MWFLHGKFCPVPPRAFLQKKKEKAMVQFLARYGRSRLNGGFRYYKAKQGPGGRRTSSRSLSCGYQIEFRSRHFVSVFFWGGGNTKGRRRVRSTTKAGAACCIRNLFLKACPILDEGENRYVHRLIPIVASIRSSSDALAVHSTTDSKKSPRRIPLSFRCDWSRTGARENVSGTPVYGQRREIVGTVVKR